MEYLSLGNIVDSFGLDGTVKIYSTTNQPKKRYVEGNKLVIANPQGKILQEVTVVSFRHNGFFDFVKFQELANPEQVKELKGFQVQTIKNKSDLKDGEFFYTDLIGCSIIDEKKNILGTVKNVEEFPAQITLRVSRKNGQDFFVPFIKEFIKDVNIDEKFIQIKVIEGLL